MKNKALFLDRDGVLNIDYGHVGTVDRLTLIPETFDICKDAAKQNYQIIIITNQAGIAKKKFSLDNFIALTEHIIVAYKKLAIDLCFYFCPFHCEAEDHNYLINSTIQQEQVPSKKAVPLKENIFLSHYRKPSPGMILQAAEQFNINISNSIFIGDQPTDIEAAQKAGIPKRFLVNPTQNSATDTTVLKKVPSSIATLHKKYFQS